MFGSLVGQLLDLSYVCIRKGQTFFFQGCGEEKPGVCVSAQGSAQMCGVLVK